MSELKMGESGLPEANVLMARKAVVSISELSAASGLPAEHVLREVLNSNIPVVYEAHSLPGFLVDDFRKVDSESEIGGFVVNSAMDIGVHHAFSRFLKPFHLRDTLLNIIETGFSEEIVFRIPNQKWQAAFFDLPGVRVTAHTALILRIHADQFFNPTSSPTPSSAFAKAYESQPLLNPELSYACCRPDRAKELVSSLMDQFLTRKQIKWKPDQQKRMATQCGAFVELMNDPPLGALNRQLIWDYEIKLRKMPENRYSAARRHNTQDANQLLALAEEHGEARLSSASVERYMDSISSMFAWAVDNMILTHNPAKRAIEKRKKVTRDQDDRLRFDKSDLDKIFSVHWFATGTGERNKQGRFHLFRPHFYWLPLMGLYTGARLNELCQLYISDVKVTESGVHYVDFNLDGEDKIDLDGSDKSLKNPSSIRIVALHPHLVELGLPDYVKALSDAGYTRLFPELKRDVVKGYGKPAGSWFNGRFLGKQLGMPRDGMRTFHSFRHTFITALNELEVPPDIQSQLAGHSRGDSITAARYRKDAEAERLLSYVAQLDFELPPIRPFSLSDSLDAVKDALRRKSKPSTK
ncbi:site-specific integrase [Pseudomonas bubulae]|uniref:site-specific integrase n=1 Tax=Pseudomonas bubulae TaxID=2316085 RepID=UPI0039A0BF0E